MRGILNHLCPLMGNITLSYYTEKSRENKEILILCSEELMPFQMTWRTVLVLSSWVVQATTKEEAKSSQGLAEKDNVLRRILWAPAGLSLTTLLVVSTIVT